MWGAESTWHLQLCPQGLTSLASCPSHFLVLEAGQRPRAGWQRTGADNPGLFFESRAVF